MFLNSLSDSKLSELMENMLVLVSSGKAFFFFFYVRLVCSTRHPSIGSTASVRGGGDNDCCDHGHTISEEKDCVIIIAISEPEPSVPPCSFLGQETGHTQTRKDYTTYTKHSLAVAGSSRKASTRQMSTASKKASANGKEVTKR